MKKKVYRRYSLEYSGIRVTDLRVPRNPFTMRSSETIENQMIFLKLFGPGILGVLRDDYFLNKTVIFRSSPGGGKTSLLRLFSPDSLHEIFQHQSQYADLFQTLSKYGVMDDDGPALLGVYLRLSGYGAILDLDIPEERKMQYLFSSISYRLIITALLGILRLNNLENKDLERIHISQPTDTVVNSLKLPCNGKELYEQALKNELEINRLVNRFDVTWNDNVRLMFDFECLRIIAPKNILLDGNNVVSKTLIMLDDVHELRKPQRAALLKAIVPRRFPVSIWLAERLEALDLPDLVPEIRQREYDGVFLEQFWESKPRSFEGFVRSVSKQRTDMARLDVETDSLDQHLVEQIDVPERHPKFTQCLGSIKDNLGTISKRTNTYNKWIAERQANLSPTLKSLIDWRVLEIQIAREEASAQTKLFDIPLDDEPNSDGRLNAVAEFFLHHEYGIPYYFGFPAIAKMATYNIDQFLEMASTLLDDLESQMIKNDKESSLSPERQEMIIKNIASVRWRQIAGIHNGVQAMDFLTRFKDFAVEQTLKPNAPYAPGVTGIGILNSDYKKFIKQSQLIGKYKQLAEVLQTCLSHNLLKTRYYAKQGGNEFIIFYLNRILCVHFGLPLGRGGWRKKTPEDLCNWLDLQIPKIQMKGLG